VLTIGLAKSTEQIDGVGNEALDLSEDLSEDLSVDLDIACLDWLVHTEICGDLAVPTEETVGPSRDL